jgi:hypothetical protein
MRDAYHTFIMQHIADFLSARELLALNATCARMRANVPRSTWRELIDARFPHKCFNKNGSPTDHFVPYKFLINLEDRVHVAPPHGRARTFFATGCTDESCDVFITERRDILLYGDIIINSVGHMYIYDGYLGILAKREMMHGRNATIALSSVFCIPYEFHITYYDHMAIDDNVICFVIDPRVCLRKKDDEFCSFDYDGETYNIEYIGGDTIVGVRDAIDHGALYGSGVIDASGAHLITPQDNID